MKVYKLTDKDMRTYGGFQWELGVARQVERYTGKECSGGVLHSYSDPMLAVFMDSAHGVYGARARLFEARTGTRHKAGRLKHVSEELTLVREIPLPELTTEQRIEAAIRIAKLVYKDANWNKWADRWLSGTDRSNKSADKAAEAARAAARAAYAAEAACVAARAAVYAAEDAADAAYAAADAACVAANAAEAAVNAAYVDDENAKFTREVIEILHNTKEDITAYENPTKSKEIG